MLIGVLAISISQRVGELGINCRMEERFCGFDSSIGYRGTLSKCTRDLSRLVQAGSFRLSVATEATLAITC